MSIIISLLLVEFYRSYRNKSKRCVQILLSCLKAEIEEATTAQLLFDIETNRLGSKFGLTDMYTNTKMCQIGD